MQLISQIANMRKTQVDLKISIHGFASKNLKGSTKTVLTGNELDENSFAEPKKVNIFPLLYICYINKKTSAWI